MRAARSSQPFAEDPFLLEMGARYARADFFFSVSFLFIDSPLLLFEFSLRDAHNDISAR